jgi:hypothetical protein
MEWKTGAKSWMRRQIPKERPRVDHFCFPLKLNPFHDQRNSNGPHGNTYQAIKNSPRYPFFKQGGKHPSPDTQTNKPKSRGGNRTGPKKQAAFPLKLTADTP